MRKFVPAALIAGVAAIALAAGIYVRMECRSGLPDPDAVLALTKAEFKDLSGQPGSLQQWRGPALVVNFWASWCPPCREEIPGLARISGQFAANGLQVVGIAVDSADKARESAAELGINYPVLVAGLEVIVAVGGAAGAGLLLGDAGPTTTRTLAAMGAEVLKVEAPRAWDNVRTLFPIPGPEPWNASFYFNDYNREKKGLVLDLAHPRGRELLLALVAKSDAVVENYRADVLEKLGLGWGVLRQARPDVILVSMAGFGKTGADRELVGFDRSSSRWGAWPRSPATATTASPTRRASRTATRWLLPALMRREGIDMWIVVCREHAEDPVYPTLVPYPNMFAWRLTMIVFFDRGGAQGVERLMDHPYGSGDFNREIGFHYRPGWTDQPEDPWARLARIVSERAPKRIAVNESKVFPFADGLSANLKDELVRALGPFYAARLVPAERLAVGWLEERTAAELDFYERLAAVNRAIAAER